MSNNCLVTKLKASVNNNNLDYINALTFTIKWLESAPNHSLLLSSSINIYFGGIGCKFKIISNGTINGNTEYEMSYITNASIIAVDASKPTVFLVENIDKFVSAYIYESILGQGVVLNNPQRMDYYNAYGNSNNANDSHITMFVNSDGTEWNKQSLLNIVDKSIISYIWFSWLSVFPNLVLTTNEIAQFENLVELSNRTLRCKITGNISNLSNLKKVTIIGPSSIQNEQLGDISSLGNMKLLTTINLNGIGLVGSIENLVNALYADSASGANDGKKSASGASRIRIYFGDISTITFNGTEQTHGTNKYIAWDDGGSAPNNIRLENS